MKIIPRLIGRPILCICSLVAIGCAKHDVPPTGYGYPDDVAIQTYGYGVTPRADVVYQPDVVIVEEGPMAIRGASDDGQQWVIDGKVRNAAALLPGKIMLLTSRAAGRVLNVEKRGPDLVVTIGPVQLGEILKDAKFDVEVPLDAHNVTYRAVPSLPGAIKLYGKSGEPSPHTSFVAPSQEKRANIARRIVESLPIEAAEASIDPDVLPTGSLPAGSKDSIKFTVGNFEVEPYIKMSTPANTTPEKPTQITQRIGLRIQSKPLSASTQSGGTSSTAGLKVGIDIGLAGRNMRFVSHFEYRDGKLDQDTLEIVIDGVNTMDFSLLGGIGDTRDNTKIRIEIPIDVVIPLPPETGFPMVVQVKYKWLLEVGLGGANATVQTKAQLGLTGPLGYRNGAVVTPNVAEQESAMDNFTGQSLGVSGLVYAIEYRFLVGVGPSQAFGGPYTKLTLALGLTQQSALASGMAPACRAVNLAVDVGAGAGFKFSGLEVDALKKLLKLPKVNIEGEFGEQTKRIWLHDAFLPDVPACHF